MLNKIMYILGVTNSYDKTNTTHSKITIGKDTWNEKQKRQSYRDSEGYRRKFKETLIYKD